MVGLYVSPAQLVAGKHPPPALLRLRKRHGLGVRLLGRPPLGVDELLKALAVAKGQGWLARDLYVAL